MAAHEYKHTLFHGNAIHITPYSAEHPRQCSRVIKLSSVVVHPVEWSERKGPHLATFELLRLYYSVHYYIY